MPPRLRTRSGARQLQPGKYELLRIVSRIGYLLSDKALESRPGAYTGTGTRTKHLRPYPYTSVGILESTKNPLQKVLPGAQLRDPIEASGFRRPARRWPM